MESESVVLWYEIDLKLRLLATLPFLSLDYILPYFDKQMAVSFKG
jgi:hypothetical protein